MVASPPSHTGSRKLTSDAASARRKLNSSTDRSPSLTSLRAFSGSFAPVRLAICTVKPVPAAMQSPPSSHVLDDTRPMAAPSPGLRRPIMDASIYCITIPEICASIAGILSRTISESCCGVESAAPSRSRER